MSWILIIAVSVHALPAIAWAGFTFALARTGAEQAERLFVPQMGSASLAILAGAWLWSLTQGAVFGAPQRLLAAGVLAALLALGIQAASTGPIRRRLAGEPGLRARAAFGQRVSAGLLAVTIVCMVAAPYV